jgi:hypothetical protein
MHGALHAIMDGGDGHQTFKIYWDSIQNQPIEWGRDGPAVLAEKAEVMLNKFLKTHKDKLKSYQLEDRLYGEHKGVRLEGTPDFLGEYKGIPSVVDFKTSGYPYDKDKIIVNEQMYLYAHLAQTQAKYPVQQIVYFVFVKYTASIQVLCIDVDTGKLTEMLDNIAELCEDIDSRVKFPANREGCLKYGGKRCDFFDRCYPPKPTSSSPDDGANGA